MLKDLRFHIETSLREFSKILEINCQYNIILVNNRRTDPIAAHHAKIL